MPRIAVRRNAFRCRRNRFTRTPPDHAIVDAWFGGVWAMLFAMLVGGVALAIGTIAGGYRLPPLVAIGTGIGILLLVLNIFGRSPDAATGQSAQIR